MRLALLMSLSSSSAAAAAAATAAAAAAAASLSFLLLSVFLTYHTAAAPDVHSPDAEQARRYRLCSQRCSGELFPDPDR